MKQSIYASQWQRISAKESKWPLQRMVERYFTSAKTDAYGRERAASCHDETTAAKFWSVATERQPLWDQVRKVFAGASLVALFISIGPSNLLQRLVANITIFGKNTTAFGTNSPT